MSEPGFEVAAAYVRVSPDASDFAQALDEQIGGLGISVLVTPDASDFAAALDEQIGGLSASVVVTPDASDFAAALDEQIGGLSVTVGVTPNPTDLANLGDLIEGGAGGLTATANILANTTDMEDAIGENLGAVSVPVVPNMAGFADTVAEEAGGMAAEVFVTPDTSDFADALADQIGDLSVSVAVTPDATDFAEGALEKAALGAMPVSVVPDKDSLANLGSAIEEGAGDITVPVSVTPDPASVANFEASLDEMLGETQVPVSLVPDAENFQAALDEQIGSPAVTVTVDADTEPAVAQIDDIGEQVGSGDGVVIPVTVDTSSAVAGFEEVQDAEEAVASSASTVASAADAVTEEFAAVGDAAVQLGGQMDTLRQLTEDSAGSVDYGPLTAGLNGAGEAAASADVQFAKLASEFEAMSGQLDSAESLFGGVTAGMSGMSEDSAAVAQQLDNLERAFAAVGEEVSSLDGQLSAAGGAFQGVDTEISSLSGMITDLQGNLSAADATVGEFIASQDNARQAVADLATTAGSVDYSAATSGLEGVASAGDDVAKAAPAASEAASGLSGVLGSLVERLPMMATDPFMWMYGAPMVIEGVTSALSALGGAQESYIAQLQAADNASDNNIAGYEKLNQQLSGTSGSMAAVANSADEVNGKMVGGSAGLAAYTASQADVNAASEQSSSTITNLGAHLGELESQYNLTQQQAIQLASSAGVSGTQLQGSGTAAQKAMTKIEAYANANNIAATASAQASGDISTFANTALTASTRVTALDSAFSLMAGSMASTQSGMLSVDQGFVSLESDAKQAGASMTGTNQQSLALQQQFYNLIPAIENTANAMTKQGDSTQQVSSYIQTNIDKLSGLTGGSAQAQQAVSGLQQFEDKLATSTGALGTQIVQAAGFMQDEFNVQLENAGKDSTTTKGQIDLLTTSILATGTTSTDTASARAQLIKDLEQSGVNAQTATTMVDNYIKELGKIPKNVSTAFTETATGTWSISGSETAGTATASNAGGGSNVFRQAAGGLIQGGSRHPRADDIPALLSHGEYVVQAGAVSKYGKSFMDSLNAEHFAEGGYTGDLSGLGSWTASQYVNSYGQFTDQLLQAIATALAQAQGAASKGNVNLVFTGTQMPTPEQTQALMSQLAAAVGVS